MAYVLVGIYLSVSVNPRRPGSDAESIAGFSDDDESPRCAASEVLFAPVAPTAKHDLPAARWILLRVFLAQDEKRWGAVSRLFSASW